MMFLCTQHCAEEERRIECKGYSLHTLLRERKSRNAILNRVHFTLTTWTALCKTKPRNWIQRVYFTHTILQSIYSPTNICSSCRGDGGMKRWPQQHVRWVWTQSLRVSERVFLWWRLLLLFSFFFLVVVSYYLSGPSFVRCLWGGLCCSNRCLWGGLCCSKMSYALVRFRIFLTAGTTNVCGYCRRN